MKRVLDLTLAILMLVALLAGCVASNAPATTELPARDDAAANAVGEGTAETGNTAPETAAASTEPEPKPDGEESIAADKPVINIGWDAMTEEDRSSLQTEIFHAIQEADAETLAPYVVEHTTDSLKRLQEDPEMFALYQSLMSRVTYEDGFISGPSIKYLLGSWWIEHSHDAQWAYLSDYAAELFAQIDKCPVVTYRWDMDDSLWGEAYQQQILDVSAVLHPLGIDPLAFSADPATALAAESLVTASGQDLLEEVVTRDARNMEGYFQTDIAEMVKYIEENQTDDPGYPALKEALSGTDVTAVSAWARDNVLVVYDGTNVYYYIPNGNTYTYWELISLPGLTNPGKATQNDISIVDCVIHAYNVGAAD